MMTPDNGENTMLYSCRWRVGRDQIHRTRRYTMKRAFYVSYLA